MIETKRFSLVKPTRETPFHIDFDWWKEHDNNWRVFLYSYLCPEHQNTFSESANDVTVDYVDPETAEVRPVDGLLHTLITHCAKQEGFATGNSSLVDSVFRALLTHGNEPMTPEQLSVMVDRPADIILRTLSGMNYKGLRPFLNKA